MSQRPKSTNRGVPYVLVNMAMSVDGKIATANHELSTFGSKRDREHLLELRATADAVLVGARTVQAQPITLGPGPEKFRQLRLRQGLNRYNLRVIASGTASIRPDAHIFRSRFSPVIVLTTARASKRKLRQLKAVGAVIKICGKKEIDFRAAFRWLYGKWGVKRLVCEGGGELNDALFRARLVDELHLTICPVIFGGRTAPTIADGEGVPRLRQAARFKLDSVRRLGDELFLVLRRTG